MCAADSSKNGCRCTVRTDATSLNHAYATCPDRPVSKSLRIATYSHPGVETQSPCGSERVKDINGLTQIATLNPKPVKGETELRKMLYVMMFDNDWWKRSWFWECKMCKNLPESRPRELSARIARGPSRFGSGATVLDRL